MMMMFDSILELHAQEYRAIEEEKSGTATRTCQTSVACAARRPSPRYHARPSHRYHMIHSYWGLRWFVLKYREATQTGWVKMK